MAGPRFGAKPCLGRELLRSKRPAEAAAKFREVLRLRPDGAEYHGYIGNAYLNVGRPAEALPLLERARRMKPTAAWMHEAAGRALAALGRMKEAKAAYEEALRCDARNSLARNNLAWLLATAPDPALRDHARALGLATRAVAENAKSPNFRNTLGIARYRTGDWKGALADLEKAVALRGSSTAHEWFFMAMAHWQLGAKEQARRLYAQAADWTRKHGANDEELRGFQAEAAKLLEMAVE